MELPILDKFIVKENLGKTLESIRQEKGLSKMEFSKLGKISQSYYSELIHNKKTPNLETMEKFCNNIKVPLYILIFKAMQEDNIEHNEKRKLVREIEPLMNKISAILYNEEIEMKPMVEFHNKQFSK